jgi:hypothetical protein
MAELIALVGPPGRGKSTSVFPNTELGIKGLDLSKTLIINISNKPLSMRGWKKVFNPAKPIKEGGNYIVTHDPELIASILDYVEKSRPDIENVVIEDAQYIMGFATMERAKEKGYDKWVAIADLGFRAVSKAKDLKRENLYIFFIYHDEKGNDGEMKIKTAGKMVDDVITLEGLFSTILFAAMDVDALSKQQRYYFITNADGTVKARSKFGTFRDLKIPNDLGLVKEAIVKYNQGD